MWRQRRRRLRRRRRSGATRAPAHRPFDVDKETVEILAKKGITNFTPVQAQSYDMLLAGHDVLARSRTGTGKTPRQGAPIVQKIAEEARDGMRSARGRTPRCVVIAPTRELAKQVAETFEMLARPHRLVVTTFHGGVPYPRSSGSCATASTSSSARPAA